MKIFEGLFEIVYGVRKENGKSLLRGKGTWRI